MKNLNKPLVCFFGVRLQFVAALSIALFIGASQLGCSTLSASRLQSAIEKTEKTATAVCTAAELFESFGIPQPALDTCRQALPVLQKDEYKLIVRAVDCVAEKNNQERAVCIAGLENWKSVAEKLK